MWSENRFFEIFLKRFPKNLKKAKIFKKSQKSENFQKILKNRKFSKKSKISKKSQKIEKFQKISKISENLPLDPKFDFKSIQVG